MRVMSLVVLGVAMLSRSTTRAFLSSVHHPKPFCVRYDKKLLLSSSSSDGTITTKKKKKLRKVRRPDGLRADRVLSNRGWGSRSECQEVLQAKRVRVMEQGKLRTVRGPSDRVPLDAVLWVDDEEIPQIPLLLVYYKPKWVLSVMSDGKRGRPNLGDYLPEGYQRQKLHPVGRLDYDTSGLILFSSSGPLTQRLLHPQHHVEKEYVATVEGHVNEEALRTRLQEGVDTSEGTHTAFLGTVQHLSSEASRTIQQQVRDTLPHEYNTTELEERGYLRDDPVETMSELRLVVSEGKHRMVRKMLANCGYPVWELRRDRQGEIELGDLTEGEFRYLTLDEEVWAQSLMNNKKKP